MTGLVVLLFAGTFVRRRTEKIMKEKNEQINLFLKFSAGAIYGIDLQGKCTFCNSAALQMLGMKSENELLEKSIHEIIHHKRADGTPYPPEECKVCLAYRQGINLHVEDEVFWRADGTSLPVEYWSHPIQKGGRTVGAVVTFLDISERKTAEERSREAVRELNSFVYTVSHDLRAPLTVITGFAELLRQSPSKNRDENDLIAIANIQSQCKRMASMLEDLLAFAKVGKLPPPEEAVNLNGVLEIVLKDLRPQIIRSGLEVRKGYLPLARIPETLLSQIFSNLISNAVSYSGKNGGPVEVTGERTDKEVRLFVRDHGPGIAPTERQKIFEVFYRGSSGKCCPGTGVGLATVHKIARLYGGRAWIEDTPLGGATFGVELIDS